MKRKIIITSVCLIVTIIGYNLIKQIIGAIRSGDRLSAAADNIISLQIQNKELKKKLAQVVSPEFIEEQARNKLNFTKKGETLIIIPDEKIKQILGTSTSAEKTRLPNWLGWWKVFFP